jgi:hypothetical protein
MSAELSVSQVLANLEAQMAFHRERETHHAEQEAVHREKRDGHAAEYETVARHYEAFKASAGAATEIALRTVVPAAAPPEEAPPAGPTMPHKLVARAVAAFPAGEVFSPSRVAAEVNRRFARELRKPIDPRLASTALRRLLALGRIRLKQKGAPHHEALYTRS